MNNIDIFLYVPYKYMSYLKINKMKKYHLIRYDDKFE